MQEFHLFKCQLETWTWICKIKAEEKLDYLLCILGKEGYANMDRWVPADEAHKNDPRKFLDYIESTLDDEISPQVCVYKLEDITKRSDKSIDELVDQISQLTHRAQISNGSDAAIEFKVQCRLIQTIPDADIELCKQLLKVSCDMLWNQEQLQYVQVMEYMLYATPARHMIPSCRCHMHCAPTAPVNTLLVDTAALLMTQHVKVVGKRVTDEQSATALTPLVHKHPAIKPSSRVMKRGENHKLPKPKQRKDPHTKTCLLLQWIAEL